MRIAVFEYLCCGGIAAQAVSDHDLAHEGRLMLNALTCDLAASGHKVMTCLDPLACRIEATPKGVDVATIADPRNWLSKWIDIAHNCDRTIVIAPELDGVFLDVVKKMRDADIDVMASDNAFIEATSDKFITSQRLVESNIPTPNTWTLEQFLSDPKSRMGLCDAHQSWVLKRRDGAGCADMKLFSDSNSFLKWLDQKQNADSWIVQPWLPGQAASVAVLAHNDSIELLGSMSQRIQLVECLGLFDVQNVLYEGGDGPLQLESDALSQFATRTIRSMPGVARGWIGIDFLLPASPVAVEHNRWEDWIVVEVNPRLTTSYLGYRKLYGSKLASAVLGLDRKPDTLPLSTNTGITFSATD